MYIYNIYLTLEQWQTFLYAFYLHCPVSFLGSEEDWELNCPIAVECGHLDIWSGFFLFTCFPVLYSYILVLIN